jgi:hypothetical protein
MSKILVQQRPGGPVRLATREEKCQHIWVPKQAWSGGRQHHYCINCPATCVGDPVALGRTSGTRRD